jgi:hypothetical protein
MYDRNDISRASTSGKRERRNEGGSHRCLSDVSGTRTMGSRDPAPRGAVAHVVVAGVEPGAVAGSRITSGTRGAVGAAGQDVRIELPDVVTSLTNLTYRVHGTLSEAAR